MRAPGGLDKLPVEGLEDVRSKEGPTKAQEGVWQAPGGAAWRVQNDVISVVFYRVFVFCMYAVFVDHVVGACWRPC